jgi:hypothetical protein
MSCRAQSGGVYRGLNYERESIVERIYDNTRTITSPFNERVFMDGLRGELSSAIFKELINGEKYGIKVRITMDVIKEQPE